MIGSFKDYTCHAYATSPLLCLFCLFKVLDKLKHNRNNEQGLECRAQRVKTYYVWPSCKEGFSRCESLLDLLASGLLSHKYTFLCSP